MPAILFAGDEDSWLDPGLGKEDIAGLLRPFPVEEIGAYGVEGDFRVSS